LGAVRAARRGTYSLVAILVNLAIALDFVDKTRKKRACGMGLIIFMYWKPSASGCQLGGYSIFTTAQRNSFIAALFSQYF